MHWVLRKAAFLFLQGQTKTHVPVNYEEYLQWALHNVLKPVKLWNSSKEIEVNYSIEIYCIYLFPV